MGPIQKKDYDILFMDKNKKKFEGSTPKELMARKKKRIQNNYIFLGNWAKQKKALTKDMQQRTLERLFYLPEQPRERALHDKESYQKWE